MNRIAGLLAALSLAAPLPAEGGAATQIASETGFTLGGPPAQGILLRGIAPPGATGLMLDETPVPLASDGAFLIGFDRDQSGTALLTARMADGTTVGQRLSVAPRRWPTQHVNAARRPDGPSEAFLRIRRAELERIGAARARGSDSGGWRQSFIWPANGRISGLFGAQRIYRGEPGSYHSGVDVAAGAGAPVVAPADGVVVLAGPPGFTLEGNLVIIDHGMGLSSAFLHLASSRVREGQIVRQSEPIGTVGATGRATGPHLHWSVMWNGARIDPQPLAGPMD